MRKIPPGFYRPPGLHPDGPDVPIGLRPCPGVTYGCGASACRSCYEPDPSHPATGIIDDLKREVAALAAADR